MNKKMIGGLAIAAAGFGLVQYLRLQKRLSWPTPQGSGPSPICRI